MRILSLDGGGIRGVLTARLLERLEKACPGFLDHVDVIAGASTGGIQALKLASGGKVTELTDLYSKRGRDIFRPRDFLDTVPKSVRLALLVGGLAIAGFFLAVNLKWQALFALCLGLGGAAILTVASKLDELFRSDYSHHHLEKVLKDELGTDKTIGDLSKYVLIPTFDMRNWNTKFFSNFPGNDTDFEQKLWEVARCTSAAPTYWPSHQWCLDGGLFANNPSDSAVAACLRHLKKRHLAEDPDLQDPVALGTLRDRLRGIVGDVTLAETAETVASIRSLGKITVLSLGTGEVPHQPPSKKPTYDAGILHVIPMLLNVVMDGGVKASTFRTGQGLNGRHVRIQPKLASVIDLAAVDSIPELIQVADLTDLEPAVNLIRDHWLPKEG